MMIDLTKFVDQELTQDNFFLTSEQGSVTLLGWGELDHDTYEFELDTLIYGGVGKYTDEGFALFRTFCEEHNVHFYANSKEDFHMFEAFDEAVRAGATYLMAENLS